MNDDQNEKNRHININETDYFVCYFI